MAINLFSGGNFINSLTAAGKNKIINGDFGVWQRGTSFSSAADSTYWADRFITNWSAGGATNTYSRQTFTAGTAPVSGYEGTYFGRAAATGATGTTQLGIGQRIEDVRTLAGQTVTFSFWAKGDSARSVSYYIQQNFGSGGSATVATSGTAATLTTSWVRYSVTVTLGAMTGKTIGTGSYLQFDVYFSSASGSPTFDIWGVQLEAGTTATTFTTASGTIQGELALCQRYYFRSSAGGSQTVAFGGNIPTSAITVFNTQLPVTMRSTPAFSSGTAASITVHYGANLSIAATTITGDVQSVNFSQWYITVAGTPFATGGASRCYSTASTGWIEFSAEL